MAEHNPPVPSTAGYSQGSASQSLLNVMDGTVTLPNDRDIVYSAYGYSEPRNAQDAMGSTIPFIYDPALMCKSVPFKIKDPSNPKESVLNRRSRLHGLY
jgi:hypothetical protein